MRLAELVFRQRSFRPRTVPFQPSFRKGVRVDTLADALADDRSPETRTNLGQYASIDKNPFSRPEHRFIQDGARVYVPRGTALSSPIHILFVSCPGDQPEVSASAAWLIVADNASQCHYRRKLFGEDTAPISPTPSLKIVAGTMP